MAPFLAPFGIESAKLGVEFSGALVVNKLRDPMREWVALDYV